MPPPQLPEPGNAVSSQNVPAGQSAATSSLRPLSAVAASQQESKVIIKRAFNKGLVLTCLMDDETTDLLGAKLNKQMMSTRMAIAERNTWHPC